MDSRGSRSSALGVPLNMLTAIFIHLIVPAIGFNVYLWLCYRMKEAKVEAPPVIPLFVLFATFGGWLLVALTALFWEWSGMASIGILFLVLIAPFINGWYALGLRKQRSLSAYHLYAYRVSIGYSGLMFVLVPIWLSAAWILRGFN